MLLNENDNRENIVNTIMDLVRFKTTDANKKEIKEAAEYIKLFFRKAPVYVEELEFGGYPSLVITTKNTKTPQFFLQGHVDVVEGSPEQFQPTRKGDRLYGRGTVDMKAFDALAMHLLREMALTNPEMDLGLMLTFDEEIGGGNGAAKLAELGYHPEILINGDGGYNHAVIHAEKGILKFKMRVRTKARRHPYPWEGENAFDLLISEYQKIQRIFPERDRAEETDNWYTTCSAYDIKVHNESFSAPDYAEMKINIYFTENISALRLYQKIEEMVQNVELELITASERVYLPADSQYVLDFQGIMQEIFNQPIVIRSENGSSDARYFTHLDIPILVVKVVGEGHHTAEEYLHIPSLMPLYKSLRKFITAYSSVSVNIPKLAEVNE